MGAQAVAYNFGDFPVYNSSASVSWGYFVALALLFVALAINIVVVKAPAKTDEELENERLAKVAIKEEQEQSLSKISSKETPKKTYQQINRINDFQK